MIPTQPTLQSVLNQAYMLPLFEQKLLINKVQDNLFESVYLDELSEAQKNRLREAHNQALAGEVCSQEEAHQAMQDFVQHRIQKSV